MDTRTTRLRSAARTAVAKALSDEKENPRGVATRSRTKTSTTATTAPRHRFHSTANGAKKKEPVKKAEPASTKAKLTKAKSTVRAPPNWAAIHAKEDAARAKLLSSVAQVPPHGSPVNHSTDSNVVPMPPPMPALQRMSVYKKPATTTTDFNFSNHRAAPRRPRPPTTDTPVTATASRIPQPSAHDGEFVVDDSALDSILGNTGVEPPRRVLLKRATMGAALTLPKREHGDEVKSARGAIERLQQKRMSLHHRVVQKPVSTTNLDSTAAVVPPRVAAASGKQAVGDGGRRETVTPDWLSGSTAVLDDAQKIDPKPESVRWQTLGANQTAPISAYFRGPGPVSRSTPANTESPPDPSFASSFASDSSALGTIMQTSGAPAEIDEKAKRASVYHGAMRVTRPKKRDPGHQVAHHDTEMNRMPHHMTPRQLRRDMAAATPRPTVRDSLANRPPLHLVTPSKAMSFSAAPTKSPGLTLMRTPRSAAWPVAMQELPGDPAAVAIPAMQPLVDPDQAEAMRELEEIRRMEEELERELLVEMEVQRSSADTAPAPHPVGPHALAFATPAWNAMPPSAVRQPPSVVDKSMSVSTDDEVSAELIQLTVSRRGASSRHVYSTNLYNSRLLSNPVVTSSGEPNAFQFVPASATGPQPDPSPCTDFRPSNFSVTTSSAFAAVPSAFHRPIVS